MDKRDAPVVRPPVQDELGWHVPPAAPFAAGTSLRAYPDLIRVGVHWRERG